MGIIKGAPLIILLFFIHFGYAQEESVLWNPEIPLSWNNFKDIPTEGDTSAALTASGISYQFSAEQINEEIVLDFQVSAFFYPQKSWYKPEVCDENILNHEQLHFDIAELFARKMEIKVKKKRFTANVKKEIKEIYQSIIKELSAFQDVYDRETDFSRNIPNQRLWNQKIKTALKNGQL